MPALFSQTAPKRLIGIQKTSHSKGCIIFFTICHFDFQSRQSSMRLEIEEKKKKFVRIVLSVLHIPTYLKTEYKDRNRVKSSKINFSAYCQG